MSPDPRHLIGTHSLRLEAARSHGGQALLAQAADLARTRLAAEADAVFTRHIARERYVRLDRIELVLGFIPEERLARDLPERFRAALEAELLRQLRTDFATDDPSGATAGLDEASRRLTLLGHLLLRGTLPWWAAPDAEFNPAAELASLLSTAPGEVAALLRRIGRARVVRWRLVRWLDDPAITAVIRTLAPADAGFILAYAADLDARQQEEPFVPAPSADFRAAKWEIILGHLLADAGSRFNAKAFLRQTTRAFADRFRLDYATLLAALAACARQVALGWHDGSLPALLLEIDAEDRKSRPAGDAEAADPARAQSMRERWDGWLRRSMPPSGAETVALAFWESLPPRDARALVEELLARHGLAALLRMLTAFDPAARETLRDLLEGTSRRPALPPSPGDARPEDDSALAVFARALDEADAKPDELLAFRTLLATGRLPWHPAFADWRKHPGDWLTLILVRHAAAVPRLLRAWVNAPDFSIAMVRRLPAAARRAIHDSLILAGDDTTMRRLQPVIEAVPRPDADESPAIPPPGDAASMGVAIEPDPAIQPKARGGVPAGASPPTLQELADLAPAARLRLLHLLLTGASPAALFALWQSVSRNPARDARAAERAEPVASSELDATGWWRVLARHFHGAPGTAAGPWRALVRTQGLSRENVAVALAAEGGARLLGEAFFEGEPAQARIWSDAIAWLETSSQAAGLVPGGHPGLRVRLWAALAGLIRESGGRPVRDAMAFLVRALARLGAARGAAGSAAERIQATAARFRAALAMDGSRAARALANRIPPRLEPAPRTPPPPLRQPDPEKIAAGASPLVIDNAGLVLLAPFFAELFKTCGLLDDGEFSGFEASQRAVHLLQFLVTGHATPHHEFSLTLNKVLCGFEPETPVVPEVELTPEECAGATSLLEFVASRWPRDAKVSVRGLRHSYLHRPGRLERKEECWSLKVETRGWDVLLPELEWAFPGPKPPWMPLPLQVDWT